MAKSAIKLVIILVTLFYAQLSKAVVINTIEPNKPVTVKNAESATSSTIKSLNPASAVNTPKLEFLKNFKGDNEIKLLNNRFRVDYQIEEVMLLFFRKHGSSPVVLVKPDGSKIYPRDADNKLIEWHADLGYDLIRLKEPMPGPWQAVGKILPDSKVLVLSNIELQADTLPQQVFQYETIKAEARVINADQIVSDKNFRSVIKLKASLYPSSDAQGTNFGSDIFQLGEFLDNGRGLDEKPRDGVFTMEYNLRIAHGDWTPKYKITTELFTRELVQDSINVVPSPISFSVQEAPTGERYHYVTIEADDSLIDNDSLLFQGEIIFPNKEKQTFSIEGSQPRVLQIFNSEYGTYGVQAQIFGTTKEGREFKLIVPPYQFLTLEPQIEEPVIELPEMTEMPMEPEVVEPPKPEFPTLFVVLINLSILIVGFLAIWLFVLKRSIKIKFSNPFAKLMQKFKKKEPKEAVPEPVKKEEKVAKKEPKQQGSDDILDLSLPED